MIEISHHGALPIHRFWPLRTHVSPSRFAVVVRPPPVPEPTSGSVRPKQPISRRPQSRQVKAEKIADAFDHDVGRRQGADTLRIAGIAALPRENGRDAATPEALDRRQDSRFVVDKHVMFSWKTPLDVIEGLFFMDIDEDTSIDRIGKARPFDFVRLKDDVSIGQDNRRPETP